MPTLRDLNSGDRAQFLTLMFYLGPPLLVLLVVGESLAYSRHMIGGGVYLLLLLLDGPAIYGFCLLLFHLMGRTAEGLTKMVYAGGGLPPEPAHSSFESLEARGFYAEAAEAWRAHLAAKPADHLARVKLAALLLRHFDDPDAAERLYLEIRRGKPAPREDRLATNLLIELYRKTGRTDRLKVELARFADQYRGTRAGDDAARSLRELKADPPGD